VSDAAPRVSVLLPVHDAASTLLEALESVSGQTLSDFECVIVDDGSRDESSRIARDHATRAGRFRVLALAHGGIVSALEHGRRSCRADYVARMDADDVMQPARLERQLALLDSRAELCGVGSHVRLVPREQLSDGRLAYERWLNSLSSERDVRTDCFVECPIAHPTLVVRRAVLERFGYRDKPWPEDYDLVLRLLGAGLAVGVVPEPLLDWRDGPLRVSRTSPRCSIESFVECKAEFLASSLLRASRQYVLWGYGSTGRMLCRALGRRDRRPVAIVELHPGRLGQRIAGAPVIAPDALADIRGAPIVVSVAGAKPRAEIRAALAGMGRTELTDFVCAA
jgi:glycosyltransferase involved in cell wall biosynthesis